MYKVTANWVRLKIRRYIFPAKKYAFHWRHFAEQHLELTYRIENSDSNEMCARRSDMLISPNRYIPAGTCMYTRAHLCIHHPHIPGNSGIRVSSLGGEIIDKCEKKYWMFLLIHSVYVSVCVHTCVLARIHTVTPICAHTHRDTQGASRGKVNILWRDSVCHCETRSSYEHVSNSDWLPRCSCLNLALFEYSHMSWKMQ
jgi:hypothetical protein